MDPRVRIATPADAAAIRSIYAPLVETTAISFEVEPPTVSDMADRIRSTLQQYPWLVCEAGSTIVGYAAASSLRATPPYEWTVELSVYVSEAARRSGVGTALYSSLLAVLELQGYYNAYAVTTLPNAPSTRFHERMGFEPVGTFPAIGYKHEEWHDIRWWYRRLSERHPDPDSPTPLPAVRDTPELEAALCEGENHVDS